METTRVRLVFENQDGILSDSQKSEGLERCWVLLKPQQQQTISDLTHHILHAFQLHPSCPHGLLLYMDGFALPCFESIAILKDKDVISVRKKGIAYPLEGNNASNLVAGLEAVQKNTTQTKPLLLANEEFETETGGYQSDEPEDESEEEDEQEESVDGSKEGDGEELLEDTQRNANSKKRKALQNLQGSKGKKQRSGVQGGFQNVVPAKQIENSNQDGLPVRKKSTHQEAKVSKLQINSGRKNTEVDDGSLVATPVIKSTMKHHKAQKDLLLGLASSGHSDQTSQKGEEIKDASGEKPKRASRSARRKKAKRRWIREMAKIQKRSSDSKTKEIQNWKQNSSRAAAKKHNNWKQKPAKVDEKEDDGQPKGLLYWKQSSGRGSSKDKKACRETNQNGSVSNQSNLMNDLDNEVVPVVVRPGHIRFEPLERETAVVQNQIPEVCNQVHEEPRQWNGIISKRKGQKWGIERNSFSRRSNYKDIDSEGPKTLIFPKETHLDGPINFEKLPVLSDLPKVGDVIGYRLLELSSSWTPELSPFRVGHVSWCNVKSGKLVLMQIPEHPVISKNSDEEELNQHVDNSLYKEDGSLEIDFSALIDVRVIKDCKEDSAEEVTGEVNEGTAATENAKLANNEEQTQASTLGTGEANGGKQANVSGKENGVNVWEQLTEALNAKKEQLSEGKTWENVSSGKGSWSYGALRRSALGPTIAYLRSKNQL